MTKAFSQACENNKGPIAELLSVWLKNSSRVLEIGSGTGQHAYYLSQGLPWLHWVTSDLAENHLSIQQWIAERQQHNVSGPLLLDMRSPSLDEQNFDAVFTANTLHIMAWELCQNTFAFVGELLPENGIFCTYGPFNYGGNYSSESNAAFDAHLKSCDPLMGIRNMEDLVKLGKAHGLSLERDEAMPANNRLLAWRKKSP